jgi:PadR family transcriptional regulator, regulatory protein PadR
METGRELLKGNTPTLVLAVLRDGPLHGYGIAREIERRSGAALKFKEGTLYPALHALEQQGLIAGEWRREEGRRERKVYSLTLAGRGALEERARTWERFASAIDRVLQGDSDGGTTAVPERRRPGLPGPRPEPAG